ncbi:unnamed protein product [Ascophyllum nodosum]
MKQGAPSAVDDVRPPPLESEGEESAGEVVDYGGDASDSSPEEQQGKALPQDATPTAEDREITLCEERLQTILPEVERARAAVTTAEEAKRATIEAPDRKRARLDLEQQQQRDRYVQERALELDREDKAVNDAQGKVRGLEEDYRSYKNRKAAAEARSSGIQASDGADARPSVTPAPIALPKTSGADTTSLDQLSAEFREYRHLRESHPDLSMREFVDFKFHLGARRGGTVRREGANRRRLQERARAESPPRHGNFDRSRGERHRRGDSRNPRERRPPARNFTGSR